MKLWFQVMETRVSSVWNQSFKRLKLLETTDNDSLPCTSRNETNANDRIASIYQQR